MKENKTFIIFGFISLISIASMVSGLTPLTNYTTNTSDQCSNPTIEMSIGVKPGTDSYNVTNINVPKNTCVTFVFHNFDTAIAHTFTINANSTINVALFNIYLQGGGTGNSTFMTPNLDVTLVYYCAVPGHYDAGMYGTLKVGLGTPNSQSLYSVSSDGSYSGYYSEGTGQSSINNNSNTISTTNYSSMALFLGFAFLIVLRKKGKKN